MTKEWTSWRKAHTAARQSLLALFLLCCVPCVFAEPAVSSSAAGIRVFWVGYSSTLHAGSSFTISFPTAMVAVAGVGQEDKQCPLRIEPELPGKWLWKSQTEGLFTAGIKVVPGTKYKVFVPDDLVDLQGAPVRSKGAVAERESEPFTVRIALDAGTQQRRPSGTLNFTYSVPPEAVTRLVYFQDRDDRRRIPVEVVVSGTDLEPVRTVTVSPREDLPRGRTFDLIAEGVPEANTSQPLPLTVHPLGTTDPLKVVRVAAINRALESKRVEISFNDDVDAAEGAKIIVEPPVAPLKFTTGRRSLNLEGPFDAHTKYRVTVPPSLVGSRGYGLAKESRWGATFHPKKPAIVFPDGNLNRRARLGLRFPLIQINTGPLHWRLARIPPEKRSAIQDRLREFDTPATDPITGESAQNEKTGFPLWKPTELLIEASHLEVLAQGDLDASPEEAETLREIVWRAEGRIPAGQCVLEVTGTNAEGKTIGNRGLVSFTEVCALTKLVRDDFVMRLTRFADGTALAGIHVRAVTSNNAWRAEGTTDERGRVTFSRADLFPKDKDTPDAQWFLIEAPDGLMYQPVEGEQYSCRLADGNDDDIAGEGIRMALVTDRPLYRPGHTVKFKGFVRNAAADGTLSIPAPDEVTWKIFRARDNDDAKEAIAEGSAKLDEFGGFEGEWQIPASVAVAHYRIAADFAEKSAGSAMINIQEFRPPPFSVTLAEFAQPGDTAGLRVKSAYFHGAPNTGARVKWRSVWRRRLPPKVYEGGSLVITDMPREISGREDEHQAEGEGTLRPDGTLDITVKQPFTDGYPRGWYNVDWNVDVTANDGQTISEPAETKVFAVPVALGVDAREVPGKAIAVDAIAFGTDDKPAPGTPLRVDIFHTVVKSVKEQLAPHIYRFQNTTRYEKETSVTGTAPFKQPVPVREPGEYIVAVRHAEDATVPVDYTTISVSGDEKDRPAEFAQRNETSFEVKCEKQEYAVGETAVLAAQAPFAGMAWVSVEAGDRILDGFEARLDANAGRIEVPIKKEYAPNAYVNVYLMRPGGADGIPAERFGSVELKVLRPDLELHVVPVFTQRQARPGQTVSGTVSVACEEHPVAGADLTVYAVDEAMLVAGGWREPDFRKAFHPRRDWNVWSHFSGLASLARAVDEADLTQKGFILGDGGQGALGPKKPVRKQFLPMAFWRTALRTGSDGAVTFSFPAPDSLTRYRLIALAQTKESQFGCGTDAVEISKPVQIEPALPRFVRTGDALEVRAIVRQKVADTLPVTLRCKTALRLEGPAEQTQTVRRDDPTVFRFRTTAGESDSVTIYLETDAGPGDAVEMTIPVHPPALLRKEAVFGTLSSPDPVAEMHRLVPERWKAGIGRVDIALSTSPWLPKLTGLPLLLEYPHGCFEQISSRVLGYTALGKLLPYLPDNGARDREYRKRVADGLERMNAALLPDGSLPYWPGGEASGLPSIQGYWAASLAQANGWETPPRLLGSLRETVLGIALGKRTWASHPFLRCYAVFVLADTGAKPEELEAALTDLYRRRAECIDAERAFLAMAMHKLNTLPDAQEQLLREINVPVKEREFDPATFSSTTRAEAIRALAFATLHPEENDGNARVEMRKRIDELIDSARSLSTQENFWLLMAFQAMHAQIQAAPVDFTGAVPAPAAVSPNKATALWPDGDIRKAATFAPKVFGNTPLPGLSCWRDARFRSERPEADVGVRTDRGFRVERVISNRTDASRTGGKDAPFRLGDELVITFRVIASRLQHYVAVEGELPACFEAVNPSLKAGTRERFEPLADGDRELWLSWAELRDRVTYLYFDRVNPGVGVSSVRARVTSAGVFHWPATQAVPMYDSQFSGVSPADVCYVAE